MANINRVTITGNLTRDPETRQAGGTTATSLRVAVNSRKRDAASGGWVDEPNYFDVTVWGAQGENCQRFLSRGRPVAIDGRLRWREWDDQNTGQKRQAVDIVADNVQFLSSGEGNGGGGGNYAGGGQSFAPQQSDVRSDTSDFQPQQPPQPAGVSSNGHNQGPADDDIPF